MKGLENIELLILKDQLINPVTALEQGWFGLWIAQNDAEVWAGTRVGVVEGIKGEQLTMSVISISNVPIIF